MRRCLVPLFALGLLAGGCTSDADGGAGGPSGGGGAEPSCEPELRSALEAWGAAGFSGSFATSIAGEVECRAAFGLADQEGAVPNTPETVFEIGSVTKSFTAAGIFDLVEAGEVALDDTAGTLVPGLTGPVAAVTVEQLLLHTSGLTGSVGADHEPLDRDAAIGALSGAELAFEPGTDDEYANAGYTLLALIIETVSGQPFRDHLASTVLALPGGGTAGGFWDGEPAAPGPRAVGYLDDGSPGEPGDFEGPHWALDGNGGLAMTVPQLASWTAALFDGEVVTAASVDAMAEPRIDLGDGSSATYGWGALDASTFGEPALAAAGGGGDVGHDAVTVWLPESRRAIAIASNTPEVTAEDLIQEIGPALAAGDPLPRPPALAPAVEAGRLAEREGTYELAGGGTIEVTADLAAEPPALVLEPSGSAAVGALFPTLPNVDASDVATHEDQVLALLGGATAEGREEREALEGDIGPLDDLAVVGTVHDGELRTYVEITSGSTTTMVWYALEDGGSIAAVEIADLPSLRIVATSPTTFRPERAGGPDAVSAVGFGEARMTLTSPAASVVAVRGG